MKRCFKCNQIVDNYVNICPGCGNNYFIPERTNSIDSNIVMQQVMPQKQNEEGHDCSCGCRLPEHRHAFECTHCVRVL